MSRRVVYGTDGDGGGAPRPGSGPGQEPRGAPLAALSSRLAAGGRPRGGGGRPCAEVYGDERVQLDGGVAGRRGWPRRRGGPPRRGPPPRPRGGGESG